MIIINGKTQESVQGISAMGADRVSIVMADDMRKAIDTYGAVERIEAEMLDRVDVYRATGDSPAQIISIYRQPERGRLTVTLQGIAKDEPDDE